MKKSYILIIILIISLQNLCAQTDIITGLNQVGRIALNGNDLYFGHLSKISKINISETTPTITDVLTGLSVNTGFSLIFNENDMYFSENVFNRISKIDITDVSQNKVNVISSGINFPIDFVLIENDLYFCQPSEGKVSKIDITDETPSVVDVVTGLLFPNGMAINGNDMYIAEINGDRISKIDISKTLPTTSEDVVTGLNRPISLALNNNELYIAENGGNKISKIDITEINPNTVDVVTGVGSPIDLVFYDNELYFSLGSGGKISKLDSDALSTNKFISDSTISLYPNPSSTKIQVSGLNSKVNYKICNTIGVQMLSGTLVNNEEINIENLANNMYFLIFENGNAIKFFKN